MKKMYFLFVLAFMLIANAVQASVTMGTQKTSITAGDKVFIGNPYSAEGMLDGGNYYWLNAELGKCKQLYATAPVPSGVFVLEAGSGEHMFKLKNERWGFYLKQESDKFELDPDDHMAYVGLVETKNAAEAAEFYIDKVTACYDMIKYDPTKRPAAENDYVIMLNGKDAGGLYGDGTPIEWYPLNRVMGIAVAGYNDYAGWWQLWEVVEENDPVADFNAILDEANKAGFFYDNGNQTEVKKFIGGTNPGCRPQEIVDAFYTAVQEGNDFLYSSESSDATKCAELAAKIEKAYIALAETEKAPMRAGYYRIVSGLNKFNPKKAIYEKDAEGGNIAWGNFEETDAHFAWKIDAAADGKRWLFTNVATNDVIYGAEGGAPAAGSATENEAHPIAIDPFTADNRWAIHFTDIEGANNHFHAESHGGGSGTGGRICFYNGGEGDASGWMLEPLSEEQINAMKEATEQAKRNERMAALIGEAKAKVALTQTFKQYITSAEQISSNADHNTLTGTTDGGGIPALVDGDPMTYFHSCWDGNKAPTADHYLQFDLKEEVNGFIMQLTGRLEQTDPNRNTPQDVQFYGAKAGADLANEASWTSLLVKKDGTADTMKTIQPTDAAARAKAFQLPAVKTTEKYQYIRMVVINTAPNAGNLVNNHHFFTLGEAQVLSTEIDPSSLYFTLPGEVGPKLTAAIEAAEKIENASEANIKTLQDALDAFLAQFADPTELKAAVKAADVFAEGVIYGKNPGEYAEGTAEEATLKAKKDAAQALVEKAADAAEAAKLTQKELDDATKALNDAVEAMRGKSNPVEENVWYYIISGYNYTPVNAGSSHKLITLDYENLTGAVGEVDTKFADSTAVVNAGATDKALWRFKKVTDSTYIIQNKDLGAYLPVEGYKARVDAVPGLFKLENLGWAEFLLWPHNFNGNKYKPLHVETATGFVTYWNAYDLGSNSCFQLVKAADDLQGTDPNMPLSVSKKVRKGDPQIVCYPFNIQSMESMDGEGTYAYDVDGWVSPVEEGTEIGDMGGLSLTALNGDGTSVDAGKGFIMMDGFETFTAVGKDYQPTIADSCFVNITFGETFTHKPVTAEGQVVCGVLEQTALKSPANVFTIARNETDGVFVQGHTGAVTIGKGQGYINLFNRNDLIDAGEGSLMVWAKDAKLHNFVTEIQNAKAEKNGAQTPVYSIEGYKVSDDASAASMKNLKKGIYIVNKKAILVK